MPQSVRYQTIIEYISQSRINSYKDTFEYSNDAEIYGVYIWSQQAAASLFPLLQNLEVTLRNAINNEAVRKFGDYWWDIIEFSGERNKLKFFAKINSAKQKLGSEWKRKERKN